MIISTPAKMVITTAPASAELLVAQLLGERCPLAPDAWLPARLLKKEAIA